MGLVFKRAEASPEGMSGLDPKRYRKTGLIRGQSLDPSKAEALVKHLYEDHGISTLVPHGSVRPLDEAGRAQFPFATHSAPTELTDFLRLHAQEHIKMGHDPDTL